VVCEDAPNGLLAGAAVRKRTAGSLDAPLGAAADHRAGKGNTSN